MRPPVLAPQHATTSREIGPVSLPVDAGGIVLGPDETGRIRVVQLFGERGTRLAIVGRSLGVLVVLRAVCVGVRVTVDAAAPAPWQRLVEAEGRWLAERVRLSAAMTEPAATGTFVEPVLVVDDTGASSSDATAGPWGCVLSVSERVAAETLLAARSADLLLMGRLSPDQAVAACPMLRLPSTAGHTLSGLTDTQIAVVADGSLSVVNLDPDEWERFLVRVVSEASPPGG
jgi:hypothetical protein